MSALADADVVFHLAAAVSADCEADFDLGIHANLEAGYALFEACRALPRPTMLVFASSLAVYGQWPGQPLPDVVTDQTLPTPRSSYGVQKFILEQLLTDYTRKGFINGRPVRLMTVSVRPGRPNGAASSFLSGIIREPLAGHRAICPVSADTEVALASPARTIEGLLRAAAVSAAEFGPPIAMNLPAVRTTVGDMVAALSVVAGPDAASLIDWIPDPAIAAIVAGWPARFETARAAALGLAADPDFASIVRAYVGETQAHLEVGWGRLGRAVTVAQPMPAVPAGGRRCVGRLLSNASTVWGVVTTRESSGGDTNVWQIIVVRYRLG